MGRILIILVLAVAGWLITPESESHALCQATTTAPTMAENSTMSAESCDLNASVRTHFTKCLAGESFCVGTSPDSYIMVRTDLLSSGKKTADAQIKASAGYAGNMICIGDSSAAAGGTIIVYDSLTETGTALFTLDIVASADYHVPMVLPIYTSAATGIYLGYTTVSDVACTVFYR